MKTFHKAFLTTVSLLCMNTSIVLANDINTIDKIKNDGSFAIATWSPDTKGGAIEGYELKGNGMIGLSIGKINSLTETIGLYGGFEKSYNSVDETTTSNEVMYAYTIFNLGLTFSPTVDLTFMAGVGYSQESAEYVENGNYHVSIEDNEQINYNFEMSYKINDKYGIVVGYDTAPEAYNVGVVLPF